MPSPRDAILTHGYTLGDLERIAKLAVARRRQRSGYTRPDAYDTAYSGIAEALYAAAEPPAERDLVTAGESAIFKALRADMKSHGLHDTTTDVGPRFAAYWHGTVTHFPDDLIVDRIALVEILPLLTRRQCEVLVAYAAAGSQAATAELLDISPNTVSNHLGAARATFLRWWHEHETPVVRRADETRCRNGHDRAVYGLVDGSGRGCRKCKSEEAQHRRRAA